MPLAFTQEDFLFDVRVTYHDNVITKDIKPSLALTKLVIQLPGRKFMKKFVECLGINHSFGSNIYSPSYACNDLYST